MTSDPYVRCKVRGCDCLARTSELIAGVLCSGCDGRGLYYRVGYPVAVCGACHGRGVVAKKPRWLWAREMDEAVGVPLGD